MWRKPGYGDDDDGDDGDDGDDDDGDYDDDVADTSQSPHPLVTTTPELSTAVAHQGVGESV